MLIYVKGNLLDKQCDIFCHQVNCKGVMGSGIAKQIADKYPEVKKEYKQFCGRPFELLGSVQIIKTHDNRLCVNLFGQDSYGRDKQYTDYNAFQEALYEFEKYLERSEYFFDRDKYIAFPYKIGCGLGGGDWKVISSMLETFSDRIDHDVHIVQKGEHF